MLKNKPPRTYEVRNFHHRDTDVNIIVQVLGDTSIKFSPYTQERRVETRIGKERGCDFIVKNGEITRGGQKRIGTYRMKTASGGQWREMNIRQRELFKLRNYTEKRTNGYEYN